MGLLKCAMILVCALRTLKVRWAPSFDNSFRRAGRVPGTALTREQTSICWSVLTVQCTKPRSLCLVHGQQYPVGRGTVPTHSRVSSLDIESCLWETRSYSMFSLYAFSGLERGFCVLCLLPGILPFWFCLLSLIQLHFSPVLFRKATWVVKAESCFHFHLMTCVFAP